MNDKKYKIKFKIGKKDELKEAEVDVSEEDIKKKVTKLLKSLVKKLRLMMLLKKNSQ